MKNHSIKAVLFVLLAISLFSISCKDESVTPSEDEKTLNKELLLNKQWENSAGHVHIFKDDGLYGFEGSWKWLNNSDSMEITAFIGNPTRVWYFDWCTESQMQCRLGKNGGEVLYIAK